jgi:hypothetical protein
MYHSSFKANWIEGVKVNPKILVLEVRHRDQPEGDPIMWLLTESQEQFKHDTDGNMSHASICIFWAQIKAKQSYPKGAKGNFSGSYCKYANVVSLTSTSTSLSCSGYVGAGDADGGGDLPVGHRIGTYLMNEIVQWVQRWPEATVNTVTLLSSDALGNNKERRIKFYEQFGLTFNYNDPERKEGKSRPMLAGELSQVSTWGQNITELNMFDYLGEVLYSEERASTELAFRDRACKELIAGQRQAEAKPVRWLLKTWYLKLSYQSESLVILLFLLVVVAVIWSR